MKFMGHLSLLKILLLVIFTCVIGCAGCTADMSAEDPDLPELIYADNLQAAINEVLLKYPEHELGISAAVRVPGYKTWSGFKAVIRENQCKLP